MMNSDERRTNVPTSPARRGYGGRSAEELSAERRQRLLASGLELFGTQGYPPTTVEILCRHAKVTTRHFYEQFADRESLLITLFEAILQETQARVLSVMADPVLPPEAKLLAALDTFLAHHLDDPRKARITTQEILGVSPRAEASRQRVITGFAGLLEQYLAMLAANGTLPGRNFRVPAFGIVGAMHELQIAWLDGALGLTREELVAELGGLVRVVMRD